MRDIFGFERFGKQVAIATADEGITYVDLAARTKAAAAHVTLGDLAAVECDNRAASLIAYLTTRREHIPALLIESSVAPELRSAQLYR